MLALIVQFRIKPAHVEDFALAITENARISRETEIGCRLFDVCRDPADASSFLLYELYDDDAAIEAHLATPHFLQMDRASTDWVERKTVWRYERVAP